MLPPSSWLENLTKCHKDVVGTLFPQILIQAFEIHTSIFEFLFTLLAILHLSFDIFLYLFEILLIYYQFVKYSFDFTLHFVIFFELIIMHMQPEYAAGLDKRWSGKNEGTGQRKLHWSQK